MPRTLRLSVFRLPYDLQQPACQGHGRFVSYVTVIEGEVLSAGKAAWSRIRPDTWTACRPSLAVPLQVHQDILQGVDAGGQQGLAEFRTLAAGAQTEEVKPVVGDPPAEVLQTAEPGGARWLLEQLLVAQLDLEKQKVSGDHGEQEMVFIVGHVFMVS